MCTSPLIFIYNYFIFIKYDTQICHTSSVIKDVNIFVYYVLIQGQWKYSYILNSSILCYSWLTVKPQIYYSCIKGGSICGYVNSIYLILVCSHIITRYTRILTDICIQWENQRNTRQVWSWYGLVASTIHNKIQHHVIRIHNHKQHYFQNVNEVGTPRAYL